MKSVSQGSIKELLMLAWPMVVARSSQAVIGFVDAIMVAGLGEDELAAVTTGALNHFMLGIFPIGLVFIVQSFASQYKGRGDLHSARRFAWYGLIVAAITGIVAVATIPLLQPLLSSSLFSLSDPVVVSMAGYLAIRSFGVAPMIGIEALGNWYSGLGNTRIHMVAGIIQMVANVVLNWVLIHGRFGLPAMGANGAALGSTIAIWLGFFYVFLLFYANKQVGSVTNLAAVRLRWAEFLRMLRFGVPNGANWFFEFSAFIVFINFIVADLGTSALAAMMVVFNINSVSFMPAFGISSAGAILAGQAIGAGLKDHVAKTLRTTLLVTVSWQTLVGAVYLLVPGFLVSAFWTESGGAELLSIGVTMLSLSAGWQLFDAIAMSVGETLRAAGDTLFVAGVRIVLAWVLFFPGAFVWVRHFDGGVVAAMVCIIGYLFLLSIALAWRFRSGAWRRLQLTEPLADAIERQ